MVHTKEFVRRNSFKGGGEQEKMEADEKMVLAGILLH